MNFADAIVIGWLVVLWAMTIRARRWHQQVQAGLRPRPHERSYWTMIGARFAGPAWTVYTVIWFLRQWF